MATLLTSVFIFSFLDHCQFVETQQASSHTLTRLVSKAALSFSFWVLKFLRRNTSTTELMRFSCHSPPHQQSQECYFKTRHWCSKNLPAATLRTLLSLSPSCYVTSGWGCRSILPADCVETWVVLILTQLLASHRLQQSLINANDSACATRLQL